MLYLPTITSSLPHLLTDTHQLVTLVSAFCSILILTVKKNPSFSPSGGAAFSFKLSSLPFLFRCAFAVLFLSPPFCSSPITLSFPSFLPSLNTRPHSSSPFCLSHLPLDLPPRLSFSPHFTVYLPILICLSVCLLFNSIASVLHSLLKIKI